MFCYYENSDTRNLEYTKSKKNFSNFLNKVSNNNSICFEEIYLDNTFGNLDKRNKIIPKIIKSVIEKKPNPIIEPNSFINLVHINDVVKRLLIAIKSKESGSTSFLSQYSYNLNSIFEFLKNYIEYEELNPNLLKFKENSYVKSYPKINLKNIKLSKLEISLIDELKKYEN